MQSLGHDAPPSSQPRPLSSSSSSSANQDSTPSPDSNQKPAPPPCASTNADYETIIAAKAREGLQEIETIVQDFARTHPFWDKRKGSWEADDMKEFASDVYTFSGEAGLSDNLAKVQAVRSIITWNKAKGIPKERQMAFGDLLSDNEIDPALIAVERARHLVELTSAGMSYQSAGSTSPLKRKRRSTGVTVRLDDSTKLFEQLSMEALNEAKRQRKAEKKARQKAAKLEKIKREEDEKQRRLEKRVTAVKDIPKPVLHSSQDWYKGTEVDEPTREVVDAASNSLVEGGEPKISVKQRKKAKKEKQAREKAAILAANPDAAPETMRSGAALREMERENKRLKKQKKLEKKRAKLGPETSSHFAKPGSPAGPSNSADQPATTVIDVDPAPQASPSNAGPVEISISDPKPPVPAISTNLAPQPSAEEIKARQAARKERRKKNRKAREAKAQQAPLPTSGPAQIIAAVTAPTISTPAKIPVKDLAEEAREASLKAAEVAEKMAENNEKLKETLAAPATEKMAKKRERHRKRNKNRLSGVQSAADGNGPMAADVDVDVDPNQGIPASIVPESEGLPGDLSPESAPLEEPQNFDGEEAVIRDGAKVKEKKERKPGPNRKPKEVTSEAPADEAVDLQNQFSTEVPDGSEPAQDSIEEPIELAQKKRHRDRGRKSKVNLHGSNEEAIEEPSRSSGQLDEEQNTSQPLSELADTNSKKPKGGRRDRGRKRNSEATALDVDPESLEQRERHSKDHHS